VFSGLAGIGTQCVGGDYSSPRKVTGTLIACVASVASTVFGAFIGYHTYAGSVATIVAAATLKKRSPIEVEFDHPFGFSTISYTPSEDNEWPHKHNRAVITFHEMNSQAYYWSNVSHHFVSSGIGTNTKRSTDTLEAYFSWQEADTTETITQDQISEIADAYTNFSQNNNDDDQACISICDQNSHEIVTGFYGYYDQSTGGQEEPENCSNQC